MLLQCTFSRQLNLDDSIKYLSTFMQGKHAFAARVFKAQLILDKRQVRISAEKKTRIDVIINPA